MKLDPKIRRSPPSPPYSRPINHRDNINPDSYPFRFDYIWEKI